MEKEETKPSTAETRSAIVETYDADMASVLENDTSGLVRKIIHGEEEHEEEKKNLSPESRKNRFFMLVSILLVLVAIFMLVFFFFKKEINVVPVAPQFVPIIFSEQSTNLDISGLKKDAIAQTVLNQVNATPVKAGALEGIYLSEDGQVVGLRRFITLIKSRFLPVNDKFFVSDNFLMGVVNVKTESVVSDGTGFFILLKVRELGDIFDALRAWEDYILPDLYGFFGVQISSETNYLFTKDFEDGIVENKNSRILYDTEGKIVLMYILADDNSVIITDSRAAAHEIVLRLASSEKKQ